MEASGDVDVLLLDKTGTITLGNRQATEFLPMPGVPEGAMAEAAQIASLADETPEGRSIVVLAKQYGLREQSFDPSAHFVPFSAETRMSGVDRTAPGCARAPPTRSSTGSRATAARRRPSSRPPPTASPARAARPWRSPATARCSA